MKDVRFAKLVLLVNGLVPGLLLLWDALHGRAGANPVNYAILTTGLLALIFLSLSLLVTPLRKITGLNWLFHFRRSLGLFAFFYAASHFAIFFMFARAWSVRDTLSEMVKRPYLIVGSVGLLAMVPLAATSTNYMIKRMGPLRWRALHRLAYFAVSAGVVHFYMQVKSDIRMPVAFGSVVGILLGYRVVMFIATRLRSPAAVRTANPVDAAPDNRRWVGQLRVERVIQETPDVRTFRLVAADGGAFPFTHLPGQFLTFSLPVGGRTVRRNYTIASTPTRAGHCEVTIKREEQGLFSRHMHEMVKVGDLVSITAPSGRFTFAGADTRPIALLAAGVGITPLMSILRYLTDQHWAGQVYLVYSNKTERDIIFREEIERLQRQFPNIHVVLTLTRADGAVWDGHLGRIDAGLIQRVIPDVSNTQFYLCGPTEMLTGTRGILRDLGVDEVNIRTESFGSPRLVSAGKGLSLTMGENFTVTFVRSNKVAMATGGRPILEVAEALGVVVDSECRSGICGRCKCHLIAGSVKMETQDALNDDDRQNNTILLCQARPLEDVTVEA